MTDAEKQELVDRVMSFVWKAQAGIAFIDITVLKITVGTGQTWRREDLALDALQQLRQLMILDDLANV